MPIAGSKLSNAHAPSTSSSFSSGYEKYLIRLPQMGHEASAVAA